MQENALLTTAALSLLVVSALVYLTTILREAPFVKISCRILLARLGLAAAAALIVFLLNEMRLVFALASKTLLEVVIVVIIIAVIVGIALQYFWPYVRDAQRAKKITDAALAVARIVSGKDVGLADLVLLLAQGVPPLTHEKLVAIARELNRLAADLGFDAAGVWTWLREQKLHGMVEEALDPLLARIDEALQSPDVSDEDRAALEELKRYLEELKRTAPGAAPAEGDEDG